MAGQNRYIQYKPKESLESKYRINEQITAPTLRVISEAEEEQQLGILTREEALAYAKSHDMDLIEVATKADPPVARVQLWSKFKFELIKKEKIAKKKNKSKEIKEMWFQPLIGKNDLDHKVKRVREFLDDKHNVKLVVRMHGRINPQLGMELMKQIILSLEDVSVLDSEPKREQKQIISFIRPSKPTK